MTDLHLQISEELAERLNAEAAERQMAPEDVVTEMLDRGIRARRRLRFVGVGHSGHHDNAERAEDLLRDHFAK
jgi:hypothetical protein